MNKLVKNVFSIEPKTLDFSFPVNFSSGDKGVAKFTCEEISIRPDSVCFNFKIDSQLSEQYGVSDSSENRALRITFAKNFIKNFRLDSKVSFDIDEINEKFQDDLMAVKFIIYTY